MFVKFSFVEVRAVVPSCWAGIYAHMPTDPVLVDDLPENAEANHIYVQSEQPYQYDCYVNCGDMSAKEFKKALAALLQHYEPKRPIVLITERTPEANGILQYFQSLLTTQPTLKI